MSTPHTVADPAAAVVFAHPEAVSTTEPRPVEVAPTVWSEAALPAHPVEAAPQPEPFAKPSIPVVTTIPTTPATTSPPSAVHAPTAVVPKTTFVATKAKKKKSAVTVTMATAATAQASGQGAQGENTGRWTAEEHNLFLQGLELHGKGWKKIASLIKSRTVVQIRTHAQKYFQKLAKARQNGEEGDVAMEGRGVTASDSSVSTCTAQPPKRRRQTSGAKRKTIQSVVPAAQRPAKKVAAAPSTVAPPAAPQPTVTPSLNQYVLPTSQPPHTEAAATVPCVPSITTAQGTISGPALEDSLFRFLTPAPAGASSEPQVNDVARQAGANPITVPPDHPGSIIGGEVSPTGVSELSMYPSWTDAKDTPSWYAKGSDVDAFLDVADTLEWLADAGDLHEGYDESAHDAIETAPSIPDHAQGPSPAHTADPAVNHVHVTSHRVEDGVDAVVPPLPSLFDGATEEVEPARKVESHVAPPTVDESIDEHLQVFENPLEEHDFVTSMLENTVENAVCLPVLQ